MHKNIFNRIKIILQKKFTLFDFCCFLEIFRILLCYDHTKIKNNTKLCRFETQEQTEKSK